MFSSANPIRLLSDTVPKLLPDCWIVCLHLGTVFCGNCKHNNDTDECRFYRFPHDAKEFKKWRDLVYFTDTVPAVGLETTVATVPSRGQRTWQRYSNGDTSAFFAVLSALV